MEDYGTTIKGKDLIIPFQLKDGVGNVVNLNDLSNYIAAIYYEHDKSVLKIFSDPLDSNYDDLVVKDAANGLFEVWLQSADMLGNPDGWLLCEAKTFESDQAFDDGIFADILRSKRITYLIDGPTSNITL